MRARASVKPSKPISAVTLVIGIGMLIVGLAMLPSFGLFGLLWLAAVLGIVGYHAMNVFSETGAAAEVVDFEAPAGAVPGLASGSDELTPEQRLARLDDMRERRVISEQEYAEQRRRILSSL
jgi:hypothetical protein